MIIWLYRQIQGVRKALAGRENPEELAWAMALGVMLGVVPKGNLIAVMLVFIVLILRVNHAMTAVTAVAVSFAAVLLDPFTHQLGQWVLGQSALQGFFAWSWQQPLIPWTDLNNTVVMGSLVFGLITLFPTYSLTLPLFRAIAVKKKGPETTNDPPSSVASKQVLQPKPLATAQPKSPEIIRADAAESRPAMHPIRQPQVARTPAPHAKVDVIRVHRATEPAAKPTVAKRPDVSQKPKIQQKAPTNTTVNVTGNASAQATAKAPAQATKQAPQVGTPQVVKQEKAA